MYTFSGKLKTVSIALMILGLLGIGYGFLSAPSTTEEVAAMQHADDGHHGGGDAHAAPASHGDASHAEAGAEHSAEEEQSHLEHLLHQAQNRPWTAFFIAAFLLFDDFGLRAGFLRHSVGGPGGLVDRAFQDHGRHFGIHFAGFDPDFHFPFAFSHALQSHVCLDG